MSYSHDPRFESGLYPFDRPDGMELGLTAADCGHMAEVGTLESVGGQELCPACYAKRLAEAKRAIAPEAARCYYPGCQEPKGSSCDCCDTPFCSDHGSKGGDREGGTNPNGSPYGAYAVPSVCSRCGGFNADEDDIEHARRTR